MELFFRVWPRGVFVDISKDYSTDAFLQVLRRFTCIRGWPRKLYSNNWSQLVSASKELRQTISRLDWKDLRQYSINWRTEWVFSAVDTPWQNGYVESLVKIVKRCLNSTIGVRIFSFSELQTVINQRPIGVHPTSLDDGRYLCPNDLLIGRASSEVPQGPFLDRVSDKYRVGHLRLVTNEFWKKWSRAVFPNLFIRPGWHFAHRNVSAGDVVLIEDSNRVREGWKLGKLKQAIKSDDGRVRWVKIEYKSFGEKEGTGTSYKGKPYTEIERPVQRLIVLLTAAEERNESEKN